MTRCQKLKATHVKRSRNVFASSGLGEKGRETVVTGNSGVFKSTISLIAVYPLAPRDTDFTKMATYAQTMLQGVKFPTSVTDLNTGLTNVDL
jgi:hypothetical protein